MKEIYLPYDARRNLKGHEENYQKRVLDDDLPKGNCLACAAAQCQTNVTSQAALAQLQQDPITSAIVQYECDDLEEDPIAVAADLSYLDDIVEYEPLPGEHVDVSTQRARKLAKDIGPLVRVLHSFLHRK